MNSTMLIPVLAAVLPVLCVQMFSIINTRKQSKNRLIEIEHTLNELIIKITRVEIVNLCDHDHGSTEMQHLLKLYDFYKEKGGNSYIDGLVAKKKSDVAAQNLENAI